MPSDAPPRPPVGAALTRNLNVDPEIERALQRRVTDRL